MAKKIVCRFCGAKFDEMCSKCPYCGSTNYKGAEAEYLEKLEAVREDMEDLENVPEEEAKAEFKKQGNFVKKAVVVIAVILVLFGLLFIWSDRTYNRDQKADFLWKEENIPMLNSLYEEGKYEELVNILWDESNEDAPIWEWEHSDFCSRYESVMNLQNYFRTEAEGTALTQREQVLVFCEEWRVIGASLAGLDDQEKEIIAEYAGPIIKDFEERWKMSEEDYAYFDKQLQQNGGWISYEECEKYVEKWWNNQ